MLPVRPLVALGSSSSDALLLRVGSGVARVGSLLCECACAGVYWRSVYVEYGYTTLNCLSAHVPDVSLRGPCVMVSLSAAYGRSAGWCRA